MYNLSVLKDKYIQDLLFNEDLMGDLLINLYCLINGEIAIHPDCLINFTVGNDDGNCYTFDMRYLKNTISITSFRSSDF